MRASPRPSRSPCSPPRRRCGCPCGRPAPPARPRGPWRRARVGRAAIGPRLLAADIHFRRPVDARQPPAPGPARRSSARPCRRGRRRAAGRRAEIFGQPLAPALAAKAALAIAAEAGAGVEQVGRVDPDHAGLELRGDLKRAVEVLGPHRGGEAVARVVGERHRLVGRAEAHRHQHRAEHFFARQQRGRLDAARPASADRTSRERAARRRPDRSSALGAPRLDQPRDALELHGGDDGADVGRLVERLADGQLAMRAFSRPGISPRRSRRPAAASRRSRPAPG